MVSNRWSHITGTVYIHVEYTTMVIQKGWSFNRGLCLIQVFF
jgi:hypothetical protein